MKVVIADDAITFRERVKILLADLPKVQVVGESGDGIEALQVILAQRPDVAILDIQMPGASGVQVLRDDQTRDPQDDRHHGDECQFTGISNVLSGRARRLLLRQG